MTTKVILLGTGTPIPDPEKFGPSVVVMCDNSIYIVDFGPGVVRRATAAGIRPSQLSQAFLTHMIGTIMIQLIQTVVQKLFGIKMVNYKEV